MGWEAVIGLEIHVQLRTKSKLFSGAATTYGAAPNVQACAIDLGLPGVLPVINAEAVRMAVLLGLAIGGEIAPRSVFARKNYFYPDLPKGYQISQYELPIVRGGGIRITDAGGREKLVRVTRAHLEEDAGKSVHEGLGGQTGIDLNRAGTPLIEIVSEPDLRSAAEAAAYMRKVHQLVRWLGISDGNMQEGSLRCDANVSLRPQGSSALGTRAEIKNLNSFRFIEQAVEHEIARQAQVLESGRKVAQETRLYDPDAQETRPLRSKEEAQDYRYFPDPDLLPVELSRGEVDAIRSTLPELPEARRDRFVREYGLSSAESDQLTTGRDVADYFERTAKAAGDARLAANMVTGEVAAAVNREGIDISRSPVSPEALGALLRLLADGTLSWSMAKQVFDGMWKGEGSADQIIEQKGLRQESDAGVLAGYVDQVIAANADQVAQYRAGKDKVLGFLVGQVMKLSGGKANPQQVNALLRERLGR
jgi:aspartyl-tRNA(Asn)/glutamyl-tRNA(Gln) amidotransferase subunit B